MYSWNNGVQRRIPCTNGAIYWTESTAFAVSTQAESLIDALGEGLISDETAHLNGRCLRFSDGTLYWKDSSQLFLPSSVYAIYRENQQLGFPKHMAKKVNEEQFVKWYECENGAICDAYLPSYKIEGNILLPSYTPEGNALIVLSRPIFAKRWANRWLGKPTSTMRREGAGTVMKFEYGSIYWSEETGAWPLSDGLVRLYIELEPELSFLGLPISGEENSDSGTKIIRFQGGIVEYEEYYGRITVQQHGNIFSLVLCFHTYIFLSIGNPERVVYTVGQ